MDEKQQSFSVPAKHLGDTPVAPAHGVAALALDMAMKYCDMNTVKDGALYQQYKLEGRNMRELHLDMVFETAIRMEMWLLGASDRIAKIVVDALSVAVEDDEEAPAQGMEAEGRDASSRLGSEGPTARSRSDAP